jgi:hypothetical protein
MSICGKRTARRQDPHKGVACYQRHIRGAESVQRDLSEYFWNCHAHEIHCRSRKERPRTKARPFPNDNDVIYVDVRHRWCPGKLGIVATLGRKRGQLHYLNPKHPAYRQFLAMAECVDKQWAIPIWEKRQLPVGTKKATAFPVDPPCTLFYSENMSRALLFICEAGTANMSELADMLGKLKGQNLHYGLVGLVERGILKASPRTGWRGNPWDLSLNESHFASRPLKRILKRLLILHPDIKPLVATMRQFRKDRRHPENKSIPTIKGEPG